MLGFGGIKEGNSGILNVNPDILNAYRLYIEGKPIAGFRTGISRGIIKKLQKSISVEFYVNYESTSDYSFNFKLGLNNNLNKVIKELLIGGSVLFKPSISGGVVNFNYVSALNYVSSYDLNGNLVDVTIQSPISLRGKQYLVVEKHTYDSVNKAYIIETLLYLKDNSSYKQMPFEVEVEFVNLLPSVVFSGVESHLCSEAKLDELVLNEVESIINEIDAQYSRLLWEFEGGELAIHAPSSMLKPAGSTGLNVFGGNRAKATLPKGKDRLYRELEGASPDGGLTNWSPQLRDVSYINGLNELYRLLEFRAGLSRGMLSDVNLSDKTAEEIKSSKLDFYITVDTVMQTLKISLLKLSSSVDYLNGTLYQTFLYQPLGLDIVLGDSILTSTDDLRKRRSEDINERLLLVEKGILTVEEFKVWYSELPKIE